MVAFNYALCVCTIVSVLSLSVGVYIGSNWKVK